MSKRHAGEYSCWPAVGIFVLVLLGGVFTPAQAGHIGCGATLGPGGMHVLDSNVGPCDNAGGVDFAISVKSRAKFDFNGFTVSCADTNTDGILLEGIHVVGNKAVISNTPPDGKGVVTGCTVGVRIQGNKNKVTAVLSTLNTGVGFLITGSKNSVLHSIGTGSLEGFFISGNDNVLDSNEGNENQAGFVILDATGNKLTGNGAKSNTSNGYRVTAGGQNTLVDNTAELSGEDGFAIDSDNTLRDNFATRSGDDGFHVTGSNNNLSQNSSSGNRDKGFVIDGENNMVTQNSSSANMGDGFVVGGTKNTLTNNTAFDNFVDGFFTEGDGNTLLRNTAENNGDEGFDIESDFNILTGNTATGNTSNGIVISSGFVGNTVAGNMARGNGSDDLLDENGECTSNTWRNNTFDTAFPFCIQ